MPYTMQEYRRDFLRKYRNELTTEERLEGLTPDEVSRKYSPEDMEAYLKRLHVKPTASGKQKRKRGPGGRSAS